MNPYVPIFRGLDARGGRKLRTDRQTLTRDNYSNGTTTAILTAHARQGLTSLRVIISNIIDTIQGCRKLLKEVVINFENTNTI